MKTTEVIYERYDDCGNKRFCINGWQIPGSMYQGIIEFQTHKDAAAYLANYKANDRTFCSWLKEC